MKSVPHLASLFSFRFCMLACASSALAVAAPAESPDRIARIESGLVPRLFAEGQPIKWTLKERMAHYRVPGVSIAVINNGKLEWARGYGSLEAGGSEPVTADTLFQAASISKPVSALAVLRLVETGKLQLDQDINLALKSWQLPDNTFTDREKVTVRRILSHTAGLTVHGFRGYAEGQPVPTLTQISGLHPPRGAIRRVRGERRHVDFRAQRRGGHFHCAAAWRHDDPEWRTREFDSGD